jgi:hypothetical protein
MREDKGEERRLDRVTGLLVSFRPQAGSGVLVVYVMGLGPGLSAMRLALAGREHRQGAPAQLQTSVLIGCSVLYVCKPTPKPNTKTLKIENRTETENQKNRKFGSV